MKIDLKYDGKNYYDPHFTFFWNNEKDNFGIGIINEEKKNHQFIIHDIFNNLEDFKIHGASFCYYTKENVYVFDLKDNFSLIPANRKFQHSVVLLGQDSKIVEQQYKSFECSIFIYSQGCVL